MGDSPASTWSSSFIISGINHALSSTANSTSFLKPSPKDLLLLIPRTITRTGFFAFITVPERIDNLFRSGSGGRLIAEATGDGIRNFTSAALLSATSAQETATAISDGAARTEGSGGNIFTQSLSFQQIRSFGGVFTYLTSKWAVACVCFVSLRHPVKYDYIAQASTFRKSDSVS